MCVISMKGIYYMYINISVMINNIIMCLGAIYIYIYAYACQFDAVMKFSSLRKIHKL